MSKGIRPQAQESCDDGETSVYEDNYWRMICLQPLGQTWPSRVEAIVDAVLQRGDIVGKLQQGKVACQIDYRCTHPQNAMQACALHLNRETLCIATCSLHTRLNNCTRWKKQCLVTVLIHVGLCVHQPVNCKAQYRKS